MSHARGVTLVEILVSISVIAVLTGILVTTLAPVKARAAETKSLANLRGLAVTMESYALAHSSQYPWAETNVWIELGPELKSEFVHRTNLLSTWTLDRNWIWFVRDIAPWDKHFETWVSPGTPSPFSDNGPRIVMGGLLSPGHPKAPSYDYSNSFVASPRVWSGEAVTEEAIRPVLTSQVVHPSAKVLMFDDVRSYLRERQRAAFGRPLLFADGSARALFDGDAMRPVENPLRDFSPNRQRYHDTPHGVEGTDF